MEKEDINRISITWFPPSWLLIKARDKIIYIDPAWIQKNFARYPKKVIFGHYPAPMDGLPASDLPKADVILVTHHHKDHIKTATINRLVKTGTVVYATHKCAELVGREFTKVYPGDEFDVGGTKIKAIFAYNTPEGHSTRKVHHKGECVGYLVTIDGKTIYHSGDTDYIPEMRVLGNVDIAFLPIGGTFTMDVQEAVEAMIAIRPRIAVPMHYSKAEPKDFLTNIDAALKIKAVILSIGEEFLL